MPAPKITRKTANRLARATTITVLAALASGCIVLPYGGRDGRYGRGHRYEGPPVTGAVVVVPQQPRRIDVPDYPERYRR